MHSRNTVIYFVELGHVLYQSTFTRRNALHTEAEPVVEGKCQNRFGSVNTEEILQAEVSYSVTKIWNAREKVEFDYIIRRHFVTFLLL